MSEAKSSLIDLIHCLTDLNDGFEFLNKRYLYPIHLARKQRKPLFFHVFTLKDV